MKNLLTVISLIFYVSLLFSADNKVERGYVSYYSQRLEGRKMTNGERYTASSFVAAHRKYPLGTILKVTNVDNGKFVLVKVTDRGPFHSRRVIDISFAAAVSLDMIRSGHAVVLVEEANRLRDFFYNDSLSLKYSVLFTECKNMVVSPGKYILK